MLSNARYIKVRRFTCESLSEILLRVLTKRIRLAIMSFDYSESLGRLRDARTKRKRVSLPKRFFEVTREVIKAMPCLNTYAAELHEYADVENDHYSNELLRAHAPSELSQRRLAKRVTGNGNCLFNSVSVALTGKLLHMKCLSLTCVVHVVTICL